jgi:glycerol-3-phosphate acyltransferase PlsY
MMPPFLIGIGCVLAGYLAGAVPVGYLVVRWQSGIDIRHYGSGSTGTTNVYRAAGWKAAVVVFAADLLKVMVPVFVTRDLTGSEWFAAAAGVAGLAGHCWPVYSGWSGGRGATGSLAGAIVLQPYAALLGLAVAALVVWRTRYVSLGSLLGTGTGGAVMLYLISTGALPPGDIVFTIGAPLITFIRHRDNIIRLARGTERKFRQSAADIAPRSTT